MFACGINGPLELIEKGENKNCRVYSVKDKQYVPNSISTYHWPYVYPGYNPRVLWERYVLMMWKIIRYSLIMLCATCV